MRTAFALSLAAALISAVPAFPHDHLVSVQAAQERLVQVESVRQQDRVVIDRALSSPQAAAAAIVVGADLAGVREAVAMLSDAELRELANRAAALQADPVAGLDADIKMLLTIFLIVAIVILVLQAVD
jgi:hypothetical protein